MNLANRLTLLRVAMIPVFLVVLYLGFPGSNIVALVVFLLAALTDYADGQIARKRGLVTDLGKFLDPLADKILTFAAMLWFVETDVMPGWVVLIVILREFAVTALRLVASTKGVVISAAYLGKIKTVCTVVVLAAMFLALPEWANALGSAIILVTTFISGVEYFAKNKSVLSGLK